LWACTSRARGLITHTPGFGIFNKFIFFANRTLALKETTNSIKHLKKNENYNEILEKPFIFNLKTVLTACRRCRSCVSRLEVVGCGREVTERVKKTTSIPKMMKKEELSLKLLDDPKIPTATRNPRKTTPLSQASRRCRQDGVEMGRPYYTRRRRHHLQTLTLKTENEALKTGVGALPPTRAEIHRASMTQRP
jgi:hypothetical protein